MAHKQSCGHRARRVVLDADDRAFSCVYCLIIRYRFFIAQLKNVALDACRCACSSGCFSPMSFSASFSDVDDGHVGLLHGICVQEKTSFFLRISRVEEIHVS
jgi:hypothetical protein